MDRCRAGYGKRFTIKLPAQPPFVMSDPEELRDVGYPGSFPSHCGVAM